MARREQSSEQSTSTILSQSLSRALPLGEILEADKQLLQGTLSTGTVNSSSSSFAIATNPARFLENSASAKYRDIGRGSCGSVFEVPGTAYAVKKGSNPDSIWNDYNLTNLAHNSYLKALGLFERPFPGRHIPRVPAARYYNGPESKEWWDGHLTRFPEEDRTRAAVFHVDRILPAIEATREALVRSFFSCDGDTPSAVLEDPLNQDCLLRVYFGQNNPNSEPYDKGTTLRNFPLYLDQARLLELDVEGYAKEMAMGLAVLHWYAQIDAQDTEFVIGSSTTSTFKDYYDDHATMTKPVSTNDNFAQRETQLWMFDYDKCTKVDLQGSGEQVVQKYLVAVTGNDPYYPHPCLDNKLWTTFRDTYLKASHTIIQHLRLKSVVMAYPLKLIKRWEEWGVMDMEAGEVDFFRPGPDGDDEGSDSEEEPESDDDDDEEEEDDDDDDDDDDEN